MPAPDLSPSLVTVEAGARSQALSPSTPFSFLYASAAPPFRNDSRTTSCFSPASSAAPFNVDVVRFRSGVPQISHWLILGWFRKVHAGQATCFPFGSSFAGVAALPVAGVPARAGVGAIELGAGVAVRLAASLPAGVSVRPTLHPTPHSAHLLSGPKVTPAGSGLAKPHTPHVHDPTSAGDSRPVSGSPKSGTAEADFATGPRPRYRVILGEERMKPV